MLEQPNFKVMMTHCACCHLDWERWYGHGPPDLKDDHTLLCVSEMLWVTFGVKSRLWRCYQEMAVSAEEDLVKVWNDRRHVSLQYFYVYLMLILIRCHWESLLGTVLHFFLIITAFSLRMPRASFLFSCLIIFSGKYLHSMARTISLNFHNKLLMLLIAWSSPASELMEI